MLGRVVLSGALAGCEMVFPLERDPPELCEFGSTPPPFTDDFGTAPPRWGLINETGGRVEVSGGQLNLILGGQIGCVGVTSNPFDACGVDLVIHSVEISLTATQAYTYFSLAPQGGSGSDHDVFYEDGKLHLPGGLGIPYGDAVRWWRIRVGPTLEIETSPDGVGWVPRTSSVTPPGIDQAVLELGACNDAPVPVMETVRYDALNDPP